MAKFAVGRLVQLNSGGLTMTVTAIGGNYPGSEKHVECSWFDEQGHHRETINEDCLKPAEAKP